MTFVTDPTDVTTAELGQPHGFGPGHAGLMPQNQVIVNDAAGSGMTLDGSGAYRGYSGQFGVHLAVAPPAGITVNVDITVTATAGNGSASVSPASLAFTSGNFSTDQLVTVTGSPGCGQPGIKCHVRGGGSVDADIRVNG